MGCGHLLCVTAIHTGSYRSLVIGDCMGKRREALSAANLDPGYLNGVRDTSAYNNGSPSYIAHLAVPAANHLFQS